MAGELLYAFRIMRLPLLDAGGAAIGRVDDIVVIPGRLGAAPRVSGFVATSQRRRIFVNIGRVGTLDADGARLRSWDVDFHPFKPRSGEMLVGRDLIDRKMGDETISDIAVRPVSDGKQQWYEIAKVRLAKRTVMRRRPSYRLVDIDELPTLFAPSAANEMAAEAARLRDMHPSDVAGVVRQLPITQRRQLAAAMDDDLNSSAALAVLFELAKPLRALANRIERGDAAAVTDRGRMQDGPPAPYEHERQHLIEQQVTRRLRRGRDAPPDLHCAPIA